MARIYVDPGHGGNDPGAVANGLKEKEVALDIALKVAEHLHRHRLEVRMSRTADVAKTLQQRTDEANAWPADLYVSVHCNAAADPGARGFEVWHSIRGGKGAELAKAIMEELDRLTPLPSRGLKTRRNSKGQDYLHVIRETRMPAVLVECAFLTNPDDARYVATPQGRAAIAEAIARGVVRYLGLRWVEPETEPPAFVQAVPVEVRGVRIQGWVDRQGVTWVPVRPLAEELGAAVAWRGDHVRVD